MLRQRDTHVEGRTIAEMVRRAADWGCSYIGC
ncbi:hypothetical protein CDHC04_0102 [Corynebacterium diphtheriae HC04]|nr:hypothetical protein CDHC04_0102 [Corynebacterium diphtheriae HC04]